MQISCSLTTALGDRCHPAAAGGQSGPRGEEAGDTELSLADSDNTELSLADSYNTAILQLVVALQVTFMPLQFSRLLIFIVSIPFRSVTIDEMIVIREAFIKKNHFLIDIRQ